jgi:PAS domain S-box-containing protein
MTEKNGCLRPSGLPVLGGIPWGSHFCQFYQNQQHLQEVLVPYFKAGLENDEFCVWVTSEALTSEEARGGLSHVVPDLADREKRGQFEVFPYTEWYKTGSYFDMNRILEGWQQKYNLGLERGFAGLRVSGNTAWLESGDWDSFSEYEASIDSAIEGSRILVLCTYNLNRCGPYEVLDVVRNHQFALVLGQHGWERIEHAELRRLRELQLASEARYRQLFESIDEGFALHEMIFDKRSGHPIDYRFLEANPAFGKLTGLDTKKIIGRTVTEVLPSIEPMWIETYGRVVRTGKPERFEGYVAALGRWFAVYAYCPAPRQFAVAFSDITERRRSEEELQRSNHELEQFAYVASHDLREPLRAITGFANLLGTRYRGQLDSVADEYLGHLKDGASRMQGLISDLLEYSRVGNGLETTRVDMNACLDRAKANLRVAIQESGARVIVDERLPEVWADASLLTLVLQNLLGNAIKFHKTEVPPEIHLGSRREGSEWVLWVRDSGIGIPDGQSNRIFQIFQRLHSRDEYPGTGIGLAICKKIVERHGGRIRYESKVGQGTTFEFTLPDPAGIRL